MARAEAENREADVDALVALLQQRLARGWRRSPSAMASYLTGGVVRRWRYVEYLSRKFVDAATGKSPRQIWNLPTRYGKSWSARWGVTWVLDRTSGKARLVFVSYADTLARENSIAVRDFGLAYQDRLNFQLAPDRRQQDRWNTSTGGGLKADGMKGGILGFGAGGGAVDTETGLMVRGGILVDDPYAGWIQAHSDATRRDVVGHFKGTIRNRLDEEEAWIIVIMQRLHPLDVTQTLLDEAEAETGDPWEHVCLPALAWEPGQGCECRSCKGRPDPLGRAPGEPLEPERFTLEQVQGRHRGMGSFGVNAMEQQRPQAAEGLDFKRAWFPLFTASEKPKRPERSCTSWDLKLKDSEKGDYVVGQAWWAVGRGRWLVDQLRGQYDHATTACAIALLAVRHPEIRTHYVESAGAADEVIGMLRTPTPGFVVSDEMQTRLGMTDDEARAVERLRRGGMRNVKGEPVTQAAKPVRARVFITPYAEQRDVLLPADAPWVSEWLDEVTAFPDGLHDDQVDAFSQAMKVLDRRKSGGAGMATATGPIPG